MKRMLALLLAAVMLTGCQYMDGWDEPIGSPERETTLGPGGHADHTAAQARQLSNFFVECERNEGVTYYLSYKEPDGCVTRLYTFDNNDREPELHTQNRCFYFVESNWEMTDGTLYAVFFSGEVTKQAFDEAIALNYIVRMDEEAIYCCANQGETYLKVSLDLSAWETVSREEARSGKK